MSEDKAQRRAESLVEWLMAPWGPRKHEERVAVVAAALREHEAIGGDWNRVYVEKLTEHMHSHASSAAAWCARAEAAEEALDRLSAAVTRVLGYGPQNVGRYGLGAWEDMREALGSAPLSPASRAALDAGLEAGREGRVTRIADLPPPRQPTEEEWAQARCESRANVAAIDEATRGMEGLPGDGEQTHG